MTGSFAPQWPPLVESFSSGEQPSSRLYNVNPTMVWFEHFSFFLLRYLGDLFQGGSRSDKRGVIEFPVIKMRSCGQWQQRIVANCPWGYWVLDWWPLFAVCPWMSMFSTCSIGIVLKEIMLDNGLYLHYDVHFPQWTSSKVLLFLWLR